MLGLTWSAVTLIYLLDCHGSCAWNVSLKCKEDTTAFLMELQKETPSKYAVLMYNAFGKVGSDVEGGNVNRPGSLRECLSVEGPEFRGQYCQVFLKQDRVEYFVGVCVPDSCTESEVQTLVFYAVLSCLQALSVQNSSQGLLATESSGSSYSSLNGIRILSLLWIISGHTVQLSAWSNLDNDKRWKDMVEKNPLYVLAFSGPVYLAVDSFLLSDNTLSFSLVAQFLFKIQPLHLFIVCLTIGLFSIVQKGVFWFIAEDEVFSCKKYWWSNLMIFKLHDIITMKIYYYNKPYTRYGPYLLGILAGIYMTTKKETLIKQQWQAVIGWLCSLSVMALLVGLAYVLRDVPPYPSFPHAVYQGTHRSLWALTLVWIILACEEGYGGFVDKILSLGLWASLSNISFACYLIHPIIIILYNGKQETTMHYTDFNFFYLFLGHLLLTISVGYVLTVLIEKPYLFLSRR
uniref:Nose resistant to fluoxetine protein 6-like n=1 Tax=Sinocyclocheilus rhinocerous TaxID=307959 RepID=A0A673LBY9_9TELE